MIFPLGEVTFEEKVEDEEDQKKALAVSGFVKSHFLNGLCTALYSEDSLNLRYAFKVVSFRLPIEDLLVFPQVELIDFVKGLLVEFLILRTSN